MQVITFANNKGGVGKTTSALCVAQRLAKPGSRVLLIDCDPQANLTKSFELPAPIDDHIGSVVSGKARLADALYKAGKHLYLVPAMPDLAQAEKLLGSQPEYPFFFRDLLAAAALSDFNYVLIDTPPTLSPLTIAALGGSDAVVIPAHPDYYNFEGLETLLDMVGRVQRNFNPKLRVGGVFFTKYNPAVRGALHHQYAAEIRAHVGAAMMQTTIRDNIALKEAVAQAKSIYEWAPESNGAKDYIALTDELLARIAAPAQQAL